MTLTNAQYAYDNMTPFDNHMEQDEFLKLVDDEVDAVKRRMKEKHQGTINDIESELQSVDFLNILALTFEDMQTWEFNAMVNAKIEDVIKDYAESLIKQRLG